MAAGDAGWRLPDHPDLNVLGTDPASRRVLAQGILYPCQAIFLGSRPPPFRSVGEFPCAVPVRNQETVIPPSFRIVEDLGILVRANLTRAESEMLGGLKNVVQRVPATAAVRYLTERELQGVLQNETAKYRAAVEHNGAEVLTQQN